MVTKDRGRKWMWCFVGALVTLPFYFVRELIAAFALFAIGFAAIAFVMVSLYMLQKGWEVAVARIVDMFDKSGPFEPVVHSTVVRANVVAGVENWKQELERTCQQHVGKLGA